MGPVSTKRLWGFPLRGSLFKGAFHRPRFRLIRERRGEEMVGAKGEEFQAQTKVTVIMMTRVPPSRGIFTENSTAR